MQEKNILAEADGNNVITKYYIHGVGLMAMVTPANQVYTYHFNAVGSAIAMTDSSQTIVNKYSYDPFGNVANQVEGVSHSFKFVGQYGVMTEQNGFYYMRARYYDPSVGRFVSEDPLGFDGGDVNLMAYADSVGKPLLGTNLYLYTRNNPVNWIDPYGLYTWPYTWKGWAGVTLGLAAVATAPVSFPVASAMLGGAIIFTFWDTIEGPIEAEKDVNKAMEPVKKEMNELQKELNNQNKGCKR